ncbi:MAG: chorismate mutase [Acidimicrobiales bacterium]
MSAAVRALRGATTVDDDTREQVEERVKALLDQLFQRNGVQPDTLISILFTATDDIHSMFPAEAARRAFDLRDVPLMCARELDIAGMLPRCIRVLAHLYTDRAKDEMEHVFLEGATRLRPDLGQ